MENPFELFALRLASIEHHLVSLTEFLKSGQGNQQEDSINAVEAAKILHMAIATLYVKTSKKIVPHTKPGKKLIFSRKELDKYMSEKKVKTLNEEIEENEHLVFKRLIKRNEAA